MKHLFSLVIAFGLITYSVTAKPVVAKPPKNVLPRIAIAGLGIESSTFSPALTDEAAFHAKYGADVFSSYPFLSADSPVS